MPPPNRSRVAADSQLCLIAPECAGEQLDRSERRWRSRGFGACTRDGVRGEMMAAKLIKGIGECSGCLPVAGWWRCAGRNGLRVCAAAHAICDVRTVAADCRSVGLWLRASCKLAGPVARCCGSGGGRLRAGFRGAGAAGSGYGHEWADVYAFEAQRGVFWPERGRCLWGFAVAGGLVRQERGRLMEKT